ncbi:hypothetical protein FQR65_LT12378 [Abscondita terminalis]|nr:hypothetical protein FQR65_LT12378 [Abscondita terminalis]
MENILSILENKLKNRKRKVKKNLITKGVDLEKEELGNVKLVEAQKNIKMSRKEYLEKFVNVCVFGTDSSSILTQSSHVWTYSTVDPGQQSVMCGREYAMEDGDEARLMEPPSDCLA